jgi:anti-sigma factor RsiW
MNEEDGNARDGAGLWARARPGWRAAIAPGSAEEAPNPLMLAAYLDGALDDTGREAVEAWMAASPEALELMIAARAELGQAPPGTPNATPESLISRAQGLIRAPVAEPAGLGAWLRGLIGFEPEAWRPLAWAGVTAVLLVVVSAGSFELGRLGSERLAPIQSAALGDDLELGLDDPADDLI